jgi:hypothetical protein
MAGPCVRTECCDGPCWGTGGPAAVSLRGLGLFSGVTQDYVRTGVLDFVMGCFLSPARGWGLAGGACLMAGFGEFLERMVGMP